MNTACDQFLIASCLIQEGDRAAAALHLKAALRAIDRCRKPDLDIRADIVALLANVERNARAAA
jgi:hypothetical protein